MGAFLGVREASYDPYQGVSYDEQLLLVEKNIYSNQPLISNEDWRLIRNYILANAPDTLPTITDAFPKTNSKLFSFKPARLDPSNDRVTMVKYDSATATIFTGFQNGQLSRWQLGSNERSSQLFTSAVIDLDRLNSDFIFSLIGFMHPTEFDFGAVLRQKGPLQYDILLKDLPRPVQSEIGQLTDDSLEDLVVSTFGNLTGHFSWYKQQVDGSFEEHRLLEQPGAISTTLVDFNSDGHLDIVTLMSQGDEKVIAFYNDGLGNFTPVKLLGFPAVYGSNSMKVVDFNGDENLDLIITNGDNADLSQVLKDYHGTRIYLNDGSNTFKENYFFPMYGASNCEVADFDLDGDLDILIIAYFADFQSAQPQSVVFLESQGDLKFIPQSIPFSNQGHWLVSGLADIDHDGDQDILLGSNLFKASQESVTSRELWDYYKHDLVILENMTVDRP